MDFSLLFFQGFVVQDGLVSIPLSEGVLTNHGQLFYGFFHTPHNIIALTYIMEIFFAKKFKKNFFVGYFNKEAL